MDTQKDSNYTGHHCGNMERGSETVSWQDAPYKKIPHDPTFFALAEKPPFNLNRPSRGFKKVFIKWKGLASVVWKE